MLFSKFDDNIQEKKVHECCTFAYDPLTEVSILMHYKHITYLFIFSCQQYFPTHCLLVLCQLLQEINPWFETVKDAITTQAFASE